MKKFMELNIQRFGSTNKTTNYELSQYIGTDKPTYLGDYNGDMLKIDTAIHNNATGISGVSGSITTINNNIGTMSNLTTEEKSSLVGAINEVDSHADTNATNIGTLSNLETSNKTTIVNAINEVIERIDMSDITVYHLSDGVNKHNISNTTSGNNITLTVAQNNDGTLFKLYGTFALARGDNSGDNFSITFENAIKNPPATAYMINPIGLCFHRGNLTYLSGVTVTINTDKSITLSGAMPGSSNNAGLIFPCLYFNSNFGDAPTPQE